MSLISTIFHLLDEDECQGSGICGNGTCLNTEGGFECACMDGFTPGVMQICEDIVRI